MDETVEERYALAEIDIIGSDVFVTADGVSAKMELTSDHEVELVRKLLTSNDFWASFLDSLSYCTRGT
jgi:hypothetical protein